MTTRVTARRFRWASPVTAVALAVLAVLLAGASVPLYAVTHQNVLANGGENVALAMIIHLKPADLPDDRREDQGRRLPHVLETPRVGALAVPHSQ